MTILAKSAVAATAFVLVGMLPALSSNALANCGKPHIERYAGEVDGGDIRKNKKRGNGPSYGILEGGPRLMIVINPRREGPAVVNGKNNCDHLKRRIAAGERRLAQMNERVDQLLNDYRIKKAASTRADAYYTADAALKLDQDAKDLERALKKLRKKLKACQKANWF